MGGEEKGEGRWHRWASPLLSPPNRYIERVRVGEREGPSFASSSSRPPACHHWFLTVVAVEAEHVEFPAAALESAVRPDSKEERCAVSVVQRGGLQPRHRQSRLLCRPCCGWCRCRRPTIVGERERVREGESCRRRTVVELSLPLCPTAVRSLVADHGGVPVSSCCQKTSLPSPEDPAGKSPSPEPDHRCRQGWLPGLSLSRFGDRRYFGSAVPSSVRLSFGCCMLRLELLRLLQKWLGAEVLVAGDFELRRKGLCETFGL
ncbi:uncharacterized protein DS421_3g91460 [Arachis hypogaea]|nr:uncharacterized protein DS421_3g91460 [Arachis hypogaea]